MTRLLGMVYTYRSLLGRVVVFGETLSAGELDSLDRYERLWARADLNGFCRRAFIRVPIALEATLRAGDNCQRIMLIDVSAAGTSSTYSPYLHPHRRVVLEVEDRRAALSYKFPARVVWVTRWGAGFQFLGIPIQIRRRRPS